MNKQDCGLVVRYDAATRTAHIQMSGRTAVVPFPVYSKREADIMGREVARNLCWMAMPASADSGDEEIVHG